jgi:hypothetical protein
MCDDVQLCNRCVREFLILARTWFAFGLPSKTGCDTQMELTQHVHKPLTTYKGEWPAHGAREKMDTSVSSPSKSSSIPFFFFFYFLISVFLFFRFSIPTRFKQKYKCTKYILAWDENLSIYSKYFSNVLVFIKRYFNLNLLKNISIIWEIHIKINMFLVFY